MCEKLEGNDLLYNLSEDQGRNLKTAYTEQVLPLSYENTTFAFNKLKYAFL